MALGSDILRLIIDADSSGAVKEFQKLGKGIEDAGDKAATGFKGKLTSAFDGLQSKSSTVSGIFDKIGLSSSQAAGVISAAIPAAGVAAAAGLVAFAAKGVQAFQETALAAGKFADSTGLSVDAASRYIAVADDIGVGATTIQNAFIKMEKAMATNKSAFGDLIATTKSGGVDLDQTFLNAITHLQGIKDPIERANESSKLFGKGFAEVSQIIGTNADTLKQKLSDVSKAQVINAGELQKARDYQAAMDDLGDSVHDLSITLGQELVPKLTDLASTAATVVNFLSGAGGGLSAGFAFVRQTIEDMFNPLDKFNSLMDGIRGHVEGVAGPIGNIDFSNLEAGTVSAGGFGNALETAAGKANDLKTKWDLLKGSLSVEDAQLSLEDSFANVATAAEAAWNATATGATDAKAKVNDHKQSVVDLEQKVVDYGEKVLGLPPEVVSDILAKIDEGDLASAQTALDKAAEDRKAAFKAKEDTGATSAVEKAFETAARMRSALMQAKAETAGAEGSLNNTSRSRQASIVASANTAQAERDLNNLTRTRNMTINAQIVAKGGAGFNTTGTPAFAEGGLVPGAKGRAMAATVHGGEYVLPSDLVDSIKKGRPPGPPNMGGAQSSAGSGVVINISGAVDPYSTARQIQTILAKGGYAGFSAKAA